MVVTSTTHHPAPQVHHNAPQPKQQAQNNDKPQSTPKADDNKGDHKVNIKA